MSKVFLVLSLLASFVIYVWSEANIPASELNALEDLYYATNGPYWQRRLEDPPRWNFTATANPCAENWAGVTCSGPPQPPAIYKYVIALSLDEFRLRGTLPESIGNLTFLFELNLARNRIYGSIPATIGAMMPYLTALNLDTNEFTGTIPDSFRHLNSLEVLELSRNNLNGTLPAALQYMPRMYILSLSNNSFSGTIPAFLGELYGLDTLYLPMNALTGTIPAGLQTLQRLQHLDVSYNTLMGSLPDGLCQMSAMVYFMVHFNQLTGNIPSCIDRWSNLTYLDIAENHFSHTIPETIGNLSHLRIFWPFKNEFTGPIPASIDQLREMKQLSAWGNRLTGTLPASFGGLVSLTEVYLQENYLHGPLPAEMNGAQELRLVYFENNLFSGSLPPIFYSFRRLKELFLQSNRFEGPLAGLFSEAAHPLLKVIQISQNQFSGTIPEETFRLPQLQTFAAAVNCITGTIPAAVCNSTRLKSLILDGIQSASSCRVPLLPSAGTYLIPGDAHGTLPACLLSDLPVLGALHLSGNGLTGTLPNSVGRALIDLVLSHNALTGTIPYSFQHRAWTNLDLSYNRLSGDLDPTFETIAYTKPVSLGNVSFNASGVVYSLQNNRLSGKIPSALVDFVNVSMLGSNLFACTVDKSNLPKHDPDFGTYDCASNSLDLAYYAFLTLTGTLVAVLLFLLYGMSWSDPFSWKKSLLRALEDWDLEREVSLRHVNFVRSVADILCHIGVSCTALILVVLLPWYAIGSHFYGTYQHEYAWTVSAAFMSGLTPGLIDLFLYFFMASFVAVSAVYIVVRTDNARQRASSRLSGRTTSASSVAATDAAASDTKTPLLQRVAIYAAFFAVNVFVVVGMNVAFVTVALTQNNILLLISQIVLSGFKLLWNTVCTPYLIRLTMSGIARSHKGSGFMTVQVLVALFNNIAIPCLVVAVVSRSCFYSVFDAAADVTSSFVYEITLLPSTDFNYRVFKERVDYISYQPPFQYDYQCSSSFITYYAPAFVYLGIAAGVVAPLARVVGVHWHKRATHGTLWFKILDTTLPAVMRPIRPDEPPPIRIFDANIHVISLITYLGILLTFGVVYPPLAVAMCATMISVTWQVKLSIGRFLYHARETAEQRYVDALERDCKGTVSLQKLRRSLLIVVWFCCIFYALFVFDTIGNSVGIKRASWSLVVMSLFPLCIVGALSLRARLAAAGPDGVVKAVGYSVDENVFEMHLRRAGGSISSGMSEISMSEVDSRSPSVSASVCLSTNTSVSDLVRESRVDSTASTVVSRQHHHAVFNVLQGSEKRSNLENL